MCACESARDCFLGNAEFFGGGYGEEGVLYLVLADCFQKIFIFMIFKFCPVNIILRNVELGTWNVKMA